MEPVVHVYRTFKLLQSDELRRPGPSGTTQRAQQKLWKGKHWITSEDTEIDDEGKNLDPASGVTILLSKRFAKKMLAQGSVVSRIVWVRTNESVCILFILCVYVSHKYIKTEPVVQGTIYQIDDLLNNCKKNWNQ